LRFSKFRARNGSGTAVNVNVEAAANEWLPELRVLANGADAGMMVIN
jgi:hypothetical protein